MPPKPPAGESPVTGGSGALRIAGAANPQRSLASRPGPALETSIPQCEGSGAFSFYPERGQAHLYPGPQRAGALSALRLLGRARCIL